MADGDRFQHVTVGTSASAVVLARGVGEVEILARSGAGEVYIDPTGGTPTVGGNFDVLPASAGAALVLDVESGASQTNPPRIGLIATASTTISVRAQ